MSEHGEISVANIANFENAPKKFVIMNGEGGQKLFIMNDKMNNNEFIKDIYEEFSKPNIVNCENEITHNNDILNSNLLPVNNISVVNEPDNQLHVLDNSVGKEVTVSVTLKLKKNDKNSNSAESENAQITDQNKATNASNSGAVECFTETKAKNVNQNNSFVTKQGHEVAVAGNTNNTLVTISDTNDEKSDTDGLQFNKVKDPDNRCSLVAKQETAEDNKSVSSLAVKKENTDTNKNESILAKQENAGINRNESLVVKEEIEDANRNEHLVGKQEFDNAIKCDSTLTKQENEDTEAINNYSSVPIGQEDTCSTNETTKPSTVVNIGLPITVPSQLSNELISKSSTENSVIKQVPECHDNLQATNERTEIEILQNSTSISQKEMNQHLDNKVIVANIAKELVSVLPPTSTGDAASAEKSHPALSNETIETTKLDQTSLITCNTDQKINLSKVNSVNNTAVERATSVIELCPNLISPKSVSPLIHDTARNNNSKILLKSGESSEEIKETLKGEALVEDKSFSLKTSTNEKELELVNTNVVNIKNSDSAQMLESSTGLARAKEHEIPLKPTVENIANTNGEKVNINVKNTKIDTKIETKIDAEKSGSFSVNVNDSLPNEFNSPKIISSPKMEVNNSDPKQLLEATGINILSPKSSLSLEPNFPCNGHGSDEKKAIEKVDESLGKLNVTNEKVGTTFETNNPKNSNKSIDNQEVTSCQSLVKETLSDVINSIMTSDKQTTNDKNFKNETPTTSPHEETVPQVANNENDKPVSPHEISNLRIDPQINGTKFDESLMKKISDTLINLFIETTNNNKEFDPTSVKKGALKGFLKLYGKELVAQEERYQKQVDDLSKKLAEKQQEAKDLSEALKEAKNETMKEESSEKQRYEIQIDQLNTKIREEETKTESVSVELQYARNEIEFSRAKMRRLEEDLTKANELAESLREQDATRSRDAIRLNELEDQAKSLEDKLKKSECSRKDLETSLAEIETERDEEMKIVQDALDEAAEERQELITSFKKELELLNTTNTAREQQMLEDFEWKLHEMEKEYKSKLEDNNRQAENSLQRVKRHTDEEEIRQKLEKQKSEINAEWEDKLRKECSRLKAELDGLHSEEKHLAVESMKVQKEQEIQRLKKSWEQRHEEMATQVSSLKDTLADKESYFRRELDNQRTMTDRDLWDLRMKLQRLNESSYDQKQQLEEKYREDMERLRIDSEERIKELETRLAICDAQKGIDLIGQMEKEHKTQMQHVGEQHQLSMERLREELEAEKFQAVEDTRLLITNHHVDIENNLKEQLAQVQTNESQIRDELEAIRSSLQRRDESLRNLEEELKRYKELKNDSSSLPPATSTTSSGFNSSQYSLASNDSQGSRSSQDRYSYHDSVSLTEAQDDSQRNTGLLGKVFGGGWFTPTKSYSRRGSTPLSYKKPYS